MDHRRLAGAVTGAGLLASVGALALTYLAMERYQPPTDGGTSLAGLFFGIVLVVGVAALLQSLGAGVTVALDPPPGLSLWLLLGGVGLAAVAAVLAGLTTLPTILGEASAVSAAIDGVYDLIFVPMLALTVLAPVGSTLGGILSLLQVLERRSA